jgi:hypothetical protein
VFDTFAGLPLHALVVHAVVVLLPLMSLVTIAVAVRPGWRRAALPVVVADALVLGIAFVAKESGEALQHRLGGQVALEHGEQGALVPWFALALLVAAVVVWLARGRPERGSAALTAVSVVLAAVTGVAAIGWTVRAGDSGAREVWSGVVASTGP